jgi:hypothetical protein
MTLMRIPIQVLLEIDLFLTLPEDKTEGRR